MSTTQALSACARCRQSFPAHELNLTGGGQVCNACEADVGGDELTASTFNTVRSVAIGALVSNLAGFVFSIRSTSRTSYQGPRGGQETISVGLDLIGIAAGSVAMLFALGGIVLALKARSIDSDARSVQTVRIRKLVYIAILATLALWAGFEILDSLPTKTTRSL